jgi:DNA-binding response OmpR family regulator
LRKSGVKLKLQEQPFQVLCMLVEHPGEIVTREELRNRLWPADPFVDFDRGLNAAVKRLRDAEGTRHSIGPMVALFDKYLKASLGDRDSHCFVQ